MKRYLIMAAALGALAIGAVAVATVAAQEGTPAPVPEDSNDDEGRRDRFLDALAENLGISREELDSTIDETRIELIDQAVADGRITEERGEELKQRVEDGLPLFPGPRHHRPFQRLVGWIAGATADVLGISKDEIVEQVRDGSSLADIAEEQGMAVEDFTARLLEQAKADLDEKVADGDITQEQADDMFEHLSDNIDRIVNATPGEGGQRFRGGFGPRFGGPGGFAPEEGIPDSPF